MAVNSLQDFRDLINNALTANGQAGGVLNAPHRGFWNTMNYQQFTTGTVPGVAEQGKPVRILVPGDSAHSNIINALQGTGIFGPAGDQDQMPANGPPFFTADQIAQLAAWIDHGCPDPAKG